MDIPGFELGGLIGQGGYGAVHRARGAGGELAAVKIALPTAEARGQLEREIGFLRRVGPPTVPAILGAGVTAEDQPWVALEYLEGPSLAALLAGRERPAWEALLPAVAEAIADLHERGVVHADLKPANLFLVGSRVRLIDLGLARPVDAAGAAEEREQVRGTAWYMAPEQIQTGIPLGPAVDVYALGAIAFELVTGSPPFTGGSAAEIHHAHLARRPPALRDQPTSLDALVRACLAKQPGERPTARQAAAELRRIAGAESGPRTASAARVAPGAGDQVERRMMGLLSIEVLGDAARLQQSVSAVGGRIAHAAGGRLVLAFDSEVSENPVRRTIEAAEALAREHAIDRGVVGVGEVTRQLRRGRELLRSPAFADPSLDPARVPRGWLGLLPDAAALVPERPAMPPPSGELPGVPLAGSDTTIHTIHTIGSTQVGTVSGPDPIAAEILEAFAACCAAGQPGVAVVSGAAGLGKSHLAAGLIGLAEAGHPEAEILAWRAPEAMLSASALSADLLRHLLGVPVEVPARGARAELEAVLPRDPGPVAWPAVAVALGWLDPHAPEAARLVAVPGALRRVTMRVLGALLVERARRRPVLLVLDDAHLADDVLLDAVDFAVLPEQGAALFAVLLGRPELSAHQVGRRAAIRLDEELLPLRAAAAHELVRTLLAPVESVPRPVATRIAERAGGNPRLIIELVRGLRAAGLVGVDPGTGRPFLATDRLDEGADTPLAEWLADRELYAISADLRGHALMAAALVEPFSRAEVAAVIDEIEREGPADDLPLDAGVALERLAAADILVRTADEEFRFRSGLVRDGLVRAASPLLRRRIHDAAFRAAAERGGPDRLHHLAHYAEGSSDPSRAAAPRLALARAASARHLYLDAEIHATRALDHTPAGDPERLAALRLRGAMRYRLGRYRDALADLAAARAIAGGALERADLMLEEATAHDWMDEYARSREAFEEAERLLAGLAAVPPALELKRQLARGRSQMRYGDYAGARTTLAGALELASALGDEGYEERIGIMLMLAPLLAAAGLDREAAPMFAAAEALCEERQDHMHLCGAVLNQVMLHMARRDVDGAVASTDRARALSREYGLTLNEYRTQYNLAEIYLQAGRGAEALEHAGRAERLESQAGRP
ncbi:MAG TPA: protein kinase, partial [Kofleriaceae bacterium]|nr:protein kinase [Kofleriaceae bacterium]